MIQLKKIERTDIFIGLLISFIIFFYIFLTSDLIGFVRDEGFYMKAAKISADWFEHMEKSFGNGEFLKPFSKKSIDRYYRFNHEHPTLIKNLFGFSQYLFHRKLGWLSFAGSARLIAAIFAFLTALLIYYFGARFFNRSTAVVSTFLFFLMPHIFFHSHLACFDVPILFFWSGLFIFFCEYLLERTIGKAIFTAVFLGLAMGAKHNVFFVPVIFFLSWTVFFFVFGREKKGWKIFKEYAAKMPIIFYMFVFITIPVYFLTWPWIWFDTVDRFIEYLNFHGKHVNYTNYYFGQELARGPFPFSFPWVMSFLTAPLSQAILFLAGVYFFVKKTVTEKDKISRQVWVLLIIGSLFPIFLIAIPSVPIFGGIKHYFTGFPIMLTAGVFLVSKEMEDLGDRFLISKTKVFAVVSFVFVICVAAQVTLNVKFAKRGAAFYNQLIGGAQGAAEKRMQRNFWGYDILELVEALNKEAPVNSTVYVMGGYEGLNWNSFLFLKKEGIIRKDIKGTNTLRNADFAFFFYEKQNEHVLNMIGTEFGNIVPLAISQTDEVFYSALFGRKK